MRRLTTTALTFVGLMLGALLVPATASAASMVEYALAATAIEYGLIAPDTPAASANEEDWN